MFVLQIKKMHEMLCRRTENLNLAAFLWKETFAGAFGTKKVLCKEHPNTRAGLIGHMTQDDRSLLMIEENGHTRIHKTSEHMTLLEKAASHADGNLFNSRR